MTIAFRSWWWSAGHACILFYFLISFPFPSRVRVVIVKPKAPHYSEGHVGTVGSLKYRPGLTQRANILSTLQAQAVTAAVVEETATAVTLILESTRLTSNGELTPVWVPVWVRAPWASREQLNGKECAMLRLNISSWEQRAMIGRSRFWIVPCSVRGPKTEDGFCNDSTLFSLPCKESPLQSIMRMNKTIQAKHLVQ